MIKKKSAVFLFVVWAELQWVQAEVECCVTVTRQERLWIGSDLTGPTNDEWLPQQWRVITCNQSHETNSEKGGTTSFSIPFCKYSQLCWHEVAGPSTALCTEFGVEEGSGGGRVCFSSLGATVRECLYAAIFLWCRSSRRLERSARAGRRHSSWVMVHEFHLSGQGPHLGQIQKNVRPLRVPDKSPKGQASKVRITSEDWTALLNDKREEEDRKIT